MTAEQLSQQTEMNAEQGSVRQYFQEIAKIPLLNAEQEVEISQRIEAGLMAEHLLADENARLESEIEITDEELVWLAQDGQKAKDEMIQSNLRLSVWETKKHLPYLGNMSLLDVAQEGNAGLIRAVEKFDYTKGNKFSTYATWWVYQAITRAIADQDRTIRIPKKRHEDITKINITIRSLTRELDRSPTITEIADKVEKSEEWVVEALEWNQRTISMNTPLGEDGETELGDVIHDDAVSGPDVFAEYHDRNRRLLREIDRLLSERDAYVIKARHGLISGESQTFREISDHLGITQEGARNIEKRARSRLARIIDRSELHVVSG